MTMTSQPTVLKPGRPWEPTAKERGQKLLNFLISFALSFTLLFTTGLNGKLGWVIAFFISFLSVTFVAEYRRAGRPAAQDSLLTSVSRFAIFLAIIPIVSILLTVISKGWRGLHWGLFTQDMAQATVNDPIENGGMLAAIVGTLILVLIASIISVPLGITAAIYVVEIKGRFASSVRFFTQAMSGVPSIVAGLFIYSTICVFFGGFSAWAGALAYTILMLPTVARTSEEVLKLVPDELRAASYALGASQARTVFQVVLPTIATGLVTSAILGIARVAGETAPLLLTASYFVATSRNVNEPIASLPIYIFSSLGLGDANATTRAWGGSLVLLIVVFVLFSIARGLSARLSRK